MIYNKSVGARSANIGESRCTLLLVSWGGKSIRHIANKQRLICIFPLHRTQIIKSGAHTLRMQIRMLVCVIITTTTTTDVLCFALCVCVGWLIVVRLPTLERQTKCTAVRCRLKTRIALCCYMLIMLSALCENI